MKRLLLQGIENILIDCCYLIKSVRKKCDLKNLTVTCIYTSIQIIILVKHEHFSHAICTHILCMGMIQVIGIGL